ncbi:TetR-like C-terminal domain-containing protein [Litoribacillus peritrichatus]|uniref:TetR-like C-terminal domain-containing protein n=1 Tax=Litoribacillus peritrichatus TaxID=718191 RepID=A0ABP7ND13_9GAMM
MAWVQDYLKGQSHQQLSLRQIAKAIGYSPGTLINHFGSYAMLLLHVNAHTLDALSDTMAGSTVVGSTMAPLPPQQALLAMAKAYLNFAQNQPYAWRLVFEHRLAAEEAIPEWQLHRIDQMFAQLKAQLIRLNPSASEDGLEQTARVLWAGVHGISVLAVEDKLFSPIDISKEHMVENLMTHFLSGWCNGETSFTQGATL